MALTSWDKTELLNERIQFGSLDELMRLLSGDATEKMEEFIDEQLGDLMEIAEFEEPTHEGREAHLRKLIEFERKEFARDWIDRNWDEAKRLMFEGRNQ